MKSQTFKQGEAIVFEPKWATSRADFSNQTEDNHPLKWNELVYFLTDIPNAPGHCIVVSWGGLVVPMVHPSDFRKAKEDEL